MKIPLSWLQEYLDIELAPPQLADVLTMIGLEVDAIETLRPHFQKVVVGDVIKVEQHPDADRLRVAQVFDGTDTVQVVCGAPNCREGIKSAFAKVGATLVDENKKSFKVKKSKLRGVESFGMLCSGAELGLSSDSEGIVEFDGHLSVGTDVAAMYGETVIEVSITPNLAHCFSIFGVARELSAALSKGCQSPSRSLQESKGQEIKDQFSVTVHEPEACPRYSCRLIKGVTVAPSPEWLRTRLEAAGLRSVNNVADVTNYVLLELGHPLHAFDRDKLDGDEIHVRFAKEGETITTLDGKKQTLTSENLLICDRSHPVAIAGVMGGLHSEISAGTTDVVLESAYFSPTSIRRASKQTGLQTDSSKRFERGTDPNQVLASLNRAAAMIIEIAGGEIVPGIIDVKECAFPEMTVVCRLQRVNHVLGTQLSGSEVETTWKRLGFDYQWDGEDLFEVTVPTYRVDLNKEIDLIEEVIRFYGYEKIKRNGNSYSGSTLEDSPIFLLEREVRSRLIGLGLQELLTCDLIGPTLLDVVGGPIMNHESQVKVLNPTSIEQSILRTSLFPGLLQVVKYNSDHQNLNITGFEIGRVHFKKEKGYQEQSVMGMILTGLRAPHHWEGEQQEYDFFDIKGMVEDLLGGITQEPLTFRNESISFFHPHRQASIYVGQLELGSLGEAHPKIQRRIDMSQRVLFAEMDLHNLLQIKETGKQMQEIPVFPSSDRDWTLTLPEDCVVQTVFDQINSVRSSLLEEISLLDLFRSEKIGKDKKNVTFHFTYRNPKKTVSQESVDKEHNRIIREVESRLEKFTMNHKQ